MTMACDSYYIDPAHGDDAGGVAVSAAIAGDRVRGGRIIACAAAAWHSQQLEEPCILENPKDPTRLVMFYSGVPSSNTRLCHFGKAWALKSDPFTWHQDPGNPVFSQAASGWDSGTIRLDAVLYIPEADAYYEWHQIFKVDNTYVLSMEVGPNRGERWRTVLAVSRQPGKGWEQLDVDTVLQTRWPGIYSDDTMFHVATPAFYPIGDRWFLYVQACPLPATKNYIDGRWDLWTFVCDRRIPTRPGLADLFIPGLPDIFM